MGTNNEHRANRALNTSAFYVRSQLGEHFSPDSLIENISDLLADLMHLCKQSGISMEECLATALSNFEHEQVDLAKYIEVSGYFKDEPDQGISGYIFKIGEYDSENDDGMDDDIFFYLEEGEPIIGEHDDFVVTSFEPVSL